MQDVNASILVVEDDEPVRTSLVQVLTVMGYRTRSATDGLAALIEIRREVPDTLLSDLNMPGMSGFELLSVVRRRFPAIRVIAMSGLYSGNEIPTGVAADAFYQKGGGIDALLRVLEGWPLQTREHRNTPEPIWIQRNGHDATGEEYVTIACPECFRTFPQAINRTANQILATSCVFCHGSIAYGIVEPLNLMFSQRQQPAQSFAEPDTAAA
jgi:CheY-like chemotaxis protein